MATTAVHHPGKTIKIPAVVLGAAAAAAVTVATVAIVTDRDSSAPRAEQAVEPAPLSGLGYIFSEAFPTEVVAPSPPSGLGFVFSEAFPTEQVMGG